MHYNVAEVLAALRGQGIYNLSDVEFAVLEIDGTISVLKKSQCRALTPRDLNIPTQYEGLPLLSLVMGKYSRKTCKNNLSQDWLVNKLNELGINDISRIF